jgi:predicted MarR family transcription regulator
MGNDRGQAVVLLLAVVVTAALAVVGVGQFSTRIVHRGRAQTAADAAVLAATIGGRSAAARLAASNGAVLVNYTEAGQEVTVVVEVDGERATARATDGP